MENGKRNKKNEMEEMRGMKWKNVEECGRMKWRQQRRMKWRETGDSIGGK